MEETYLTKLNFADLAIEPTSLVIGLAAGVVVGLLIGLLMLLWRTGALKSQKAALEARIDAERAGLDDHFKALAQATLQSNSESFLNIAPAKLTGALKNPAAQGKLGEFVLERLLDKANLIKGLHYNTQVNIETGDGRLRPDVVISLQDGFNIIVDAKAPITEFINKMDQEMSEDEYRAHRQNLAKILRSHVKALGSKSYWEQLDSPDFVVLFLPSENIFSAALSADPDIVDFASENNVVIASPTLMMSLLRVVGLSWRQVEMAKNAQEVSKLGSELFDRINNFSTHLSKVGGGINSALAAYNKAIGTFETRILSSARKLKDLHVTDKEIEQPKLLEGTPRQIMSAEDKTQEELLADDDKDTSRYA